MRTVAASAVADSGADDLVGFVVNWLSSCLSLLLAAVLARQVVMPICER